jgi:hypothetical protein
MTIAATERMERQVVKHALAEIKAMGMVARYDWDVCEYRVNVRGGREATAYYTPDADDAVGTAKAMKAHSSLTTT